MRRLLAAALALAAASSASAALLSPAGVSVLDSGGRPRASFSNSETIGFSQIVSNGAASAGRISFQFSVLAPGGSIVFNHTGNSVPGRAGSSAARLSGIAISGFYRGPGAYQLKAFASLDGTTIEQSASFTLSSPNVLLIYPPNGAAGLTDNPLTFQWFSSGASSYRVTVGDNPSLYNAPYSETTAAPTLTYPQNPTDPRQRLGTGQVYYWKVEGLDQDGNVIAQSPTPFSFSVASVVLTRDLIVTALEPVGTPDSAGNVSFRVTVKNQGGSTESNIPLKFTLGGLPAPTSPVTMPTLLAGDEKTFDFAATMPPDQAQSLAIACLTIFDDTVANNCRTLQVTRPAPVTDVSASAGSVALTSSQIWQAIQQLLKEQGIDLTEYELTGMEGSLTRDELAALLDQLRQGQAQASLSGPPLELPAALPTATPTASPYASSDEAAAPEALTAAAAAAAEEEAASPAADAERRWAGYTRPLAKATVAVAITDAAKWKKLWPRLSDQPLPEVDFSRLTALVVIAGSEEPADRIEIDDMQEIAAQRLVRYRLAVHARLGLYAGPSRESLGARFAPYLVRLTPKGGAAKTTFERMKEVP